jgi:hypothetical protein
VKSRRASADAPDHQAIEELPSVRRKFKARNRPRHSDVKLQSDRLLGNHDRSRAYFHPAEIRNGGCFILRQRQKTGQHRRLRGSMEGLSICREIQQREPPKKRTTRRHQWMMFRRPYPSLRPLTVPLVQGTAACMRQSGFEPSAAWRSLAGTGIAP